MEQLSSRLPISAGSMDARTERLGLMARRSPALTVAPAPEPGSRFFFSFGRYTGVVSAVAPERDHREKRTKVSGTPARRPGWRKRNDGAAWTWSALKMACSQFIWWRRLPCRNANH